MRDFLHTWAWPIGALCVPVGYYVVCWISDAYYAFLRRRRA